ncbi:protein of unknown function [Nitrosotalea devaniterrae]|uniref:Uncharacterized protein n=1 Tax=Nitrosotalea devaniterrae TaxID=1078905 RepID=A0A128A1R2_9ARCH|nr:protein of unknown function [Candidatus Nitrosotalea devanaterra]
MEPLEFCDVCFQRGKPNLCETYRNTFTKIVSLQFSQKSRLDRILNNLEIRPRSVDKRWTLIVGAEKRKEFLDSLWGVNVTVHTLEDHVKVITRLYKPEVRKLGAKEQVELPSKESWEEFDPKTRDWIPIKVDTKKEKFYAQVNLGNVLKCSSFEGTAYFRTYMNADVTMLAPMEKRAVYNIVSTISEPITAVWKSDGKDQYGFIEHDQLPNVPDEIFNVLRRLATVDKRIPDTMIFENGDFELVQTVLGCIKIELTKSSETITTLTEKKSDVPLEINEMQKERLQVMLDIVKEMGGKIETEKDALVISGTRGLVKVAFVDSDKSAQDGNMMRISVSALEDPPRFAEILSMIKKRLGLLDLPLENMLSQHWPIISDNDLQYVIHTAISWWSNNPVLATKIIGDADKFAKVKEWNTKIKEGKIRSTLDTITLGKIIKQKESNQIIK